MLPSAWLASCSCLPPSSPPIHRALDADPVLMDRRMDLAHTAAMILDKNGLIR
jgi:hypothetical protein